METSPHQIAGRISHHPLRARHAAVLHRCRNNRPRDTYRSCPLCSRGGHLRPHSGTGRQHFRFVRPARGFGAGQSQHLVGAGDIGRHHSGIYHCRRLPRRAHDRFHSVRSAAFGSGVHGAAVVQRRGRSRQFHQQGQRNSGFLLPHIPHLQLDLAGALDVPACGDDRRRLAVRAALHKRTDGQGRPQEHCAHRRPVPAHPAHLVPPGNDVPSAGSRPRNGCRPCGDDPAWRRGLRRDEQDGADGGHAGYDAGGHAFGHIEQCFRDAERICQRVHLRNLGTEELRCIREGENPCRASVHIDIRADYHRDSDAGPPGRRCGESGRDGHHNGIVSAVHSVHLGAVFEASQREPAGAGDAAFVGDRVYRQVHCSRIRHESQPDRVGGGMRNSGAYPGHYGALLQGAGPFESGA